MGPKAKLNQLMAHFPDLAQQLPEVPALLYKALDNAAYAKQTSEAQTRELAELRKQIEANHQTTLWTILAGAAMIGAAIFFR
jgi:ubiquinone biosynthesis protein